ncbi:CsgG/HfaB family protein [Pseudochryseolinea flava]|uniref:Curli production assembly/transport component CsgG n=1 Tax=Pseudochryseolinea flava TaxID=2059302 RepID=A0A364Y7A2_9BACT|nr:CsgG/HfaB family protein [Pseudochryseolinea flava]RAW02141.1 hypothetical protein DQQ10_06230 [Pseudochryseolinea flava]
MSVVKYLCWLTLLVASLHVVGQDKPTIVFQEVNAGNSTLGLAYKQTLYETLLQALVAQRRFNVVNRSPEIWKNIEGELALQDFIDPSTAINLGKMLGAKYYIDASIVQFASDRVATKTFQNEIEYHYSSHLQVALKIVNLETGIYREALKAESTVSLKDRDISINQVIRVVSEQLMEKLIQEFPNKAKVKELNSPVITLDRGSSDGVKQFDVFKILSPEGNERGSLKIIKVSDNEAFGRLLTGDFSVITLKDDAVESFARELNVLKVEKREKERVIINGGKDLGLEKGDIYTATRGNEIKTDDRTLVEEQTVAKIYVTEVHANYAKGKIISGYKNVAANTPLTESSNATYRKNFLVVRYRAPFSVRMKPTAPSGTVAVKNETGEYNIDTEYLSDTDDIEQVTVLSAGIGVKNLKRDLSTTLSFDFYNMSPLKTWIAYLDVSYEYPVVPEKFFISVGGSAGYGRLKQELANDVVGIISGHHADDLKSSSIFLAGNVGFVYEVGRIGIVAGVSYDHLKFSKWTYEIKPDKDSEKVTAPTSIIPYSSVDLSGLFYNVGIRYIFKQ